MNTRPYELYISLDDLSAAWRPETEWTYEAPLRAALIGLELSFLLLAKAYGDIRPGNRNRDCITRLWAGCTRQIELLRDTLDGAAPPSIGGRPSSATHLAYLDGRERQRWESYYRLLFADLPFSLGLNAQLEDGNAAGRPILPYDRWVNPHAVAELYSRRNFNAEDALFASVHQITECWLFIAHSVMTQAQAAAREQTWEVAAYWLDRISHIFGYLNEHILLLETMLLADYHPLRVRLRDASGAQSRQVIEMNRAAQRLLPPFVDGLERCGLTLLDVYRWPARHAELHEYLAALGSLEVRLTGFLFHHYKLATQVLGSESFGSLGFEVRKLIDHFVEPFYPQLDDVRYQHVIVTNYLYGSEAGNIVTALDTAVPTASLYYPAPVDAEVMRAQIERYILAIRDRDFDTWSSLFELDSFIVDPETSRPFRQHEGLGIFFRGFSKVFPGKVDLRPVDIRLDPARGYAEVDWVLSTAHKGIPIHFDGTEKMSFTPNGTLRSVRVSHDTREIAQQLLAVWSREG